MTTLVLTCSLHYLAIPIILNKHQVYALTIFLATTLGIIWHTFDILMVLDYIITGLWVLQDLYWSYRLKSNDIILLNLIVFILNLMTNFTNDYIYYHSIWHVISAIKCIYIAFKIKYYFI
jgi:hypothetical protein